MSNPFRRNRRVITSSIINFITSPSTPNPPSKEVKYPNITLVLQGIIHKRVSFLTIIEKYAPLCNIIISIYDTDYNIVTPIVSSYSTISVVVNKQEEFEEECSKKFPPTINKNCKNGYYCLLSLKSALPFIKTEYVIKSRVDHYYEGIERLINQYMTSNRIVTSSLYVRGPNNNHNSFRYHLSDCLYMLNIHQFTRLLDLAYTKFENIVSEVEFWKPYLQELCEMDDTTSMNDYIRYMCTYVEVLPIEIVAPFMIKIGNNVLRNIAEVKQTQYEYFLNGIR